MKGCRTPTAYVNCKIIMNFKKAILINHKLTSRQ